MAIGSIRSKGDISWKSAELCVFELTVGLPLRSFATEATAGSFAPGTSKEPYPTPVGSVDRGSHRGRKRQAVTFGDGFFFTLTCPDRTFLVLPFCELVV